MRILLLQHKRLAVGVTRRRTRLHDRALGLAEIENSVEMQISQQRRAQRHNITVADRLSGDQRIGSHKILEDLEYVHRAQIEGRDRQIRSDGDIRHYRCIHHAGRKSK